MAAGAFDVLMTFISYIIYDLTILINLRFDDLLFTIYLRFSYLEVMMGSYNRELCWGSYDGPNVSAPHNFYS